MNRRPAATLQVRHTSVGTRVCLAYADGKCLAGTVTADAFLPSQPMSLGAFMMLQRTTASVVRRQLSAPQVQPGL